MSKQYDVAAYVWPSYTGDEPRSRIFWPAGMGEWETVLKSKAKFPGHNWPRKPLWGYQNEADPRVMEMQIDAAADHGVNVFIYDWYWYDGRPFLENCLNDGYLKARNNHRVKFYLMWANHHVNSLWDLRLSEGVLKNGYIQDTVLWDARLNRAQFETIANRVLEKYFHHPSYYQIDGKPVFMIYDMENFMTGLGGQEAAKDALAWFRNRAVESGFPGLHLQVTLRDNASNTTGVMQGELGTPKEIVEDLGFDGLTHYQFIHFTDIDRDYADILKDACKHWDTIGEKFSIPYFPHVSVGWDNNPRFQEFFPGIVKNNTPEMIRLALQKAKDYVDANPGQHPLITVNSWNEWTETSYLQPDDLYGYGYLEAVKSVFPPQA